MEGEKRGIVVVVGGGSCRQWALMAKIMRERMEVIKDESRRYGESIVMISLECYAMPPKIAPKTVEKKWRRRDLAGNHKFIDD